VVDHEVSSLGCVRRGARGGDVALNLARPAIPARAHRITA
jgi:hypothetical protein